MPYIAPERRFKNIVVDGLETAGELNYAFTTIALSYLKEKGESYQSYNDIIGALEGCKLELYRRRVSGYEDLKCIENGDVYA